MRCARAALKRLKAGGMIILDNSDWLPDSARALRQGDLLQVDMSGFIPIGDHTQTTSLFFDRQCRFTTKGSRQPVPCVGALGWDWETVTPTEGDSLEWDGEHIYGVVRHEVMVKATPDGPRTFEIAFFDQPHRGLRELRRCVDDREPRGKLRPAPQAGTKALDLGRGGAAKKATVLAPRQAHGTNRPAIDARGAHADEEPAVETGIVRRERAIAAVGIELHDEHYARVAACDSPFSDIRAGARRDRQPAPAVA